MAELKKAAENTIKNCMNLKENESFLIITDSKKKDISEIFLKAAKEITKNAKLIEIPIPKSHGSEPPKETAEEMLSYDVILGITTKSLSHTKARKKASEKGARIATMPGITKEVIKRTLSGDNSLLHKINMKIIEKIKHGKTIRIKTKKGTDLEIEINNKIWFDDSGIYHKKGDFGNLPAGEVTCMPKEGKTKGVFIVDGSIGGIGLVDKDTRIEVNNGLATKISGGESAEIFNSQIKTKEYKNIAEFAFGTNDAAKLTGITLEDEKVSGTVHVALGNNASYGGNINVPFHSDCIIKNPDVYLDNTLIMKKGRFII